MSADFPSMLRQPAGATIVLGGLLLVLSGCRSWQASQESAIEHYAAGRLDESRAELDAALTRRGADVPLLQLEQAMLDLASGRTESAESSLRQSRREIDHLTQADLRETAAATVTDDRAVAWSGQDWERQMLLNLLTISSLLNGGEDAFAYALQLTEVCARERQQVDDGSGADAAGTAVADAADSDSGRQSDAMSSEPDEAPIVTASRREDAPVAWTDLPENDALCLSTWLRAIVQSEYPLQFEECERSLADLAAFHPEFARGRPLPQTIGTRCPAGQGGVQILFLLGRAPRRVSERVVPTSAALLMADRILNAVGEHSLPPTVAPVQIARPEPVPLPTTAARATCVIRSDAGTRLVPQRTTLVDLNRVAEAEYAAGRDAAIARAVVRRVIKKGTLVAAKEASGMKRGTAEDLVVNVAGVAWEALEKADLRSWQTLPARVDVAGLAVPAGRWTLEVSDGSGDTRTVPVAVSNGRNTLVVCVIPGGTFAGPILVAEPSRVTDPDGGRPRQHGLRGNSPPR